MNGLSREQDLANTKVEVANEKERFFEFMSMIVRADMTQRAHMGLRPGAFEEYVSRHTRQVADKIEELVSGHERRFLDSDEE